jgi:hypothetical protein
MSTIAMAFPIPPGKLDTWRSGMREIAGPRREEFDASRRGKGVSSTKVWLQQGPGGPIELLVVEVEDPGVFFAGLGRSQDPFDVWFRRLIAEVYGMDLTQPSPGPLPEQLLDWSAPDRA